MFSQITVQTKEIKSLDMIKKELQFLEKMLEYPDPLNNDKLLITDIIGYNTAMMNYNGKYIVSLRLESSKKGRTISILFIEGIEGASAEHDPNHVTIHYPMSKLDFILNQLEKGNCKLFYIYDHNFSRLIFN